jgi:hypothetical protein
MRHSDESIFRTLTRHPVTTIQYVSNRQRLLSPATPEQSFANELRFHLFQHARCSGRVLRTGVLDALAIWRNLVRLERRCGEVTC